MVTVHTPMLCNKRKLSRLERLLFRYFDDQAMFRWYWRVMRFSDRPSPRIHLCSLPSEICRSAPLRVTNLVLCASSVHLPAAGDPCMAGLGRYAAGTLLQNQCISVSFCSVRRHVASRQLYLTDCRPTHLLSSTRLWLLTAPSFTQQLPSPPPLLFTAQYLRLGKWRGMTLLELYCASASRTFRRFHKMSFSRYNYVRVK